MAQNYLKSSHPKKCLSLSLSLTSLRIPGLSQNLGNILTLSPKSASLWSTCSDVDLPHSFSARLVLSRSGQVVQSCVWRVLKVGMTTELGNSQYSLN